MTRSVLDRHSPSGGETELSDEDDGYDRGPDQAGPSSRPRPERMVTGISEARSIHLDGLTEYPLADVLVFLPTWLPDVIYDWVLARLNKRSIRCTRNYRHADVIMTYYGMTPEEEADVASMKADPEGSERIAVSTDWLARVYFTGKAHPIPKGPPLFVDEEGKSLLVVVPDLGSAERRREVSFQLEWNGAVVVPLSIANTVILPNADRNLERLTGPYKDLRRHDVDWVFQLVTEQDEARSRSTSVAPARPSNLRAPGAVVSQNRRRPHTRVNFTSEDRDYLARWLAYQRPTREGCNSVALYNRLLHYSPNDPYYGWATRHPPSAWREHYNRQHAKRWKDGTVLDKMIDRYAAQGMDYTLTVAPSQRPGTAANRPAGAENAERQDSSEAREVDGALLLDDMDED